MNGGGSQDYRAQCYAFLGKNVVETSDAMIPITVLVCDRITNVYLIWVILILIYLCDLPLSLI